MQRWIVCAVVAIVAVAAVAVLSIRIADQAAEIENMTREIEALRRDSEFWPALIRAEFLRFEMRQRAWMEGGNGAEDR